MKKYFYAIIGLLMVISATGCKSNEDKANKLIKDYMYKHLHDFKSYEVVETKVDTLYNTPIWDPKCLSLASDANDSLEKCLDYSEEADNDKRIMDIWSGGWSSSSNKEYRKAYKSFLNNKINETTESLAYLNSVKKLIERMNKLDGSKQIGWLVSHKFRSNTLGGNTSLATYIFLIDKDFKNIAAKYDDEEISDAIEVMNTIQASIKTPEQVDTLIASWTEFMDNYQKLLEKVK